MVALSPGLLNVQPGAAGPRGFPEPPPPPPSGDVVEELSAGDWEIPDTSPPPKPVKTQTETAPESVAAPESVDDFIEELPASLPPVAEEPVPSSSGIPTLQALAHHDEQPQPRADDFFANMNAAMNGGFMSAMEAPTIDVSTLNQPAAEAPSIDLSRLDVPPTGKQTLPLFGMDDDETVTTLRPPPVAAPPAVAPLVPATKPQRTVPLAPAAPSPLGGSLSPSAFDKPPVSETPRPDSTRSRRHVVAPATNSVPPPATGQRRSGLAAPILIALAAAAGFLIWKRSAATSHDVPVAEQVPAVAAPPHPEPAPVAPAPIATTPEPVVAAAPAATEDDITFQTAPKGTPPKATAVAENKPEAPTSTKEPVSKPQAEAKPEPATPTPPAAPTAKEEPKPKPEPREPAGEPEGPFDRAAAAAALSSTAAQASACRKEGDPSGVASVVITFAPSGRVTSANISGPPFAGTATGGCIAAALRKARVPPFEGDRVTVSKTIVIQ